MAVLNARRVLVTGSNRGIGLELVRQLVRKNNCPEHVFATCRDPDGPLAQDLRNLAAKHQGVEIIPLDTCDPSSIKAAATKVTKRLKGAGLNLLINNAGILKPGSLETETPENMAEVYKTNVIGPMMLSQAFLPLLRKASRESPQNGMSCSKAAIVNVSSEGGSITNVYMWHLAHVVSYRCSKAALNMLTRCQSLGFDKDEILCIALHPGFVQTDMGSSVGQAPLTVDESVQAILKTLSHLSEKDNGAFMNWEGNTLPWCDQH
ncbi:C-signal isoform X1 [Zootoca vivipara]|uniref:C-signal isoform X1 n=2 Tax=Zootoca vivipara TaxID=8524 RepID=UPI001591F2E2|nr:C-signal isoform X1 [Zootoca vivipara]